MKKIFGILALAGTLAGCKGTGDRIADESKVLSAADVIKSTELARQKERAAAQRTTIVYRDVNSNTATTKKKGWSSAAKGAVIGGAAGAVAGAIINKKNRAAGAVVGGAAGAGVGYTIGRARDRKTGRVRKQ